MAGHYTSLVSQQQLATVTRAFEDAIALSFVTHPMRNMTKAEVKRRFGLCDKVFTILRGDLKWSIPKIEDMLSVYLKCELDGVAYHPETLGSSWSPEGAVALIDVEQDPDFVVLDSYGDMVPMRDIQRELDAQPFCGDTVGEPAGDTPGTLQE